MRLDDIYGMLQPTSQIFSEEVAHNIAQSELRT